MQRQIEMDFTSTLQGSQANNPRKSSLDEKTLGSEFARSIAPFEKAGAKSKERMERGMQIGEHKISSDGPDRNGKRHPRFDNKDVSVIMTSVQNL